ncbi:MAG TPA: ABC transporter permease [Candidatus Acidoferrales bacterium]|nr:ABC transporter permease [Candidatus Acidoferrales bacterium]
MPTLQDIRYALRALRKSPGFFAVAVLTLGLGIGANSAIFSLVNAVLLRPLPYPNPEQLVGLGQWRNQQGEGYMQVGVSAPNIVDVASTQIFQQVAYFRGSRFNITGGDRPESIIGVKASDELLPMFGIQPLMGRFFSRNELQAGNDQVAIIGYGLWKTRYASNPAILGKAIDLDERRYTIIGVMPANFRFTWDQDIGVFVPLVLTPEEESEKGRSTTRDLQTQARLKDGISIPHAQAAMDALAINLAKKYPGADGGWGIKVEPLHAAYYRHMRTPLLIMLGAAIFVLLIACANVANLLLARATRRKREVAIRMAIGATHGRLVRQFLTESVVLAAIGGALGLAIAYAGDRLLTLALNRYQLSLPNAKIIDIDWRVLLFSVVATVGTALLFGLAPSLAAAKTDVNGSLKEAGMSATPEPGRRRMRNALVVSEVALALVLLAGAGLLIRTFIGLMNVDLGFNPGNAIRMSISLPSYRYASATQQMLFYRNLLDHIKAIPGVTAAGALSGTRVFFLPDGMARPAPGQEPTSDFDYVTPDYFRAMGISLLSGREFSASDSSTAPAVAIISETVARRFWPRSNPIGGHFTIISRQYSGESLGAGQALEIVGVVKDLRNGSLWSPNPDIYVPFSQHPNASAFLVVRSALPPLKLMPTIRNAVSALDPEQPINRVATLDQMVADQYGAIRFPMVLVWIFAALALALSAIGIFGVMSYTVSRRTQEMAIRMALGANAHQVRLLILREGLGVTLLGVAIGLMAALAMSRLMSDYVYGIKPADPVTFAAATVILIAVALLASYAPARRATRVDPIAALRHE